MPFFSKAVAACKSVVIPYDIATTGLLGWFDQETLSGTTWNDRAEQEGLVDEGLNSVFYNGCQEASIDGTTAVYFDGADDRLRISNNNVYTWPDIYTAQTGWTIEVWFRSNGSWLGNGNIWSAYINAGARIRMEGSTLRYPAIKSGTAHSVTTLSTNTWYQVVTTYTNNDGFRTYVNNASPVYQSSGWNPETWFGGLVQFGAYNTTSEFQRMYLGCYRIYNRPLSAAEVEQNWNNDKETYGY